MPADAVGVQGNLYEGYMVWISALISSAGKSLLIAGIRPEHFEDAKLVDAGDRERGVTFQADVDVTEWLGNELYAYVPFEASAEVTDRLKTLARELDSESLRTQLVVSLDTASTIKAAARPSCGSTPAACTCSTRPAARTSRATCSTPPPDPYW